MGMDLEAEIEQQLMPLSCKRIGIAVSGGGDSMALLALVAGIAARHGIDVFVISVDHGLRGEAQAEIKLVTDLCTRLGVSHSIEYWTGWDGHGNLQSRARKARYDLIASWAGLHDISTVVLGHTADDQAETVLMRLARGAGVDGLAAMVPRRLVDGITWSRPMLGIRRSDLRNYLLENNIFWSEDPSNKDRSFQRVRMREALELLEPLGICTRSLSDVARNMAQARAALDWYTFLSAKEICRIVSGVVEIDLRRYRILPAEISRRLLVYVIMWLNGSAYAPRRGGILQMQQAIKQGKAATLDGCQVSCTRSHLYLHRELNALREEICEIGDLWDERWYVTGPEDDPDITVRVLGEEGLQYIPHWRESGLPRAAVLSLPGVWYEGQLIAAPALNMGVEWQAKLETDEDAFFSGILSH